LEKLEVSYVPNDLISMPAKEELNALEIPQKVDQVMKVFNSFWNVGKMGLLLPQELRFPFQETQKNYFTSIWLQPHPTADTEIVHYYPQRYSAEFYKEYVLNHPISWKWFLYSLEFVVDSPTVKRLHERVVDRVLNETLLDPVSQKMLIALKDSEHYYSQPAMVFVTTNNINFSAEEQEIIKAIFNVEDLNTSDVAMIRCSEFFDSKTLHFKMVVEGNICLEQLVAISLKEFAETLMSGRGLFRVAPLFWTFDPTYWPKIVEFLLGSVFRQPAYITDIFIIRDSKGERIPCLMHLFASYDSNVGVRTA